MNDDPKKGGEFPPEHQEAWFSGYFWGQKSIVNTLLQDERAAKEHLLGLLRDTKMEHGTCKPRSRKACTACNAQAELDMIVENWKGFPIVPS